MPTREPIEPRLCPNGHVRCVCGLCREAGSEEMHVECEYDGKHSRPTAPAGEASYDCATCGQPFDTEQAKDEHYVTHPKVSPTKPSESTGPTIDELLELIQPVKSPLLDFQKQRLRQAISEQTTKARIDELEWHRARAADRYKANPEGGSDAATTMRVIDDRIAKLNSGDTPGGE